jgi:hypothetical protein
LERFCRDFFIKIIFAGGDDGDLNLSFADHDKEQRSKLYVKSKWNPTESDVPFWASQRYSRFAVRLQRLFRQRKAKSNLLQFQQELLEQLSEDPRLLFPETDKGLGPCAVTYDQYVEDVFVHLLNTECYKRLTEEEAQTFAERLEEEILQCGYLNTSTSLASTQPTTSLITWKRIWKAPLDSSTSFTRFKGKENWAMAHSPSLL